MIDKLLSEWYGVLAFVLFDVIAFVAIIAIAWRWLFKRVFDFLTAILCLIVASPLFLVVVIRGKAFKKSSGVTLPLIEKTPKVGKKGKTILLRSFRFADEDGDLFGNYGRWLQRTKLYKLPALLDVLAGRLAFVGVRAFSETDAEFVYEEDEERFLCRAGLINPLVLTGDEQTTYEEMIESDKRYALHLGLFRDVRIFFAWLLNLIREGKDEYLGITREKTYAETLLEEGEITEEDYKTVLEAYAVSE